MTILECRSIDGAYTAIPMDRIDSIARSQYRGKNVVVTTKSGQEYHVSSDWNVIEVDDWPQLLDKMFAQQKGKQTDGIQGTPRKPQRPRGDGAVPPVPAGRQGQ